MTTRNLILLTMILAVARLWADDFQLSSGSVALHLRQRPSDDGYAMSFRHADRSIEMYAVGMPLTVEIDADPLHGCYTEVTKKANALECRGAVTSKHGTRFVFTDRFSTGESGSFELKRSVAIENNHPNDLSFGTVFGLQVSRASTIDDFQFFVPAIWYRTNLETQMAGSLAANRSDQYFLFREDRLPLPVVSARENATGRTVSLIHVESDPATIVDENGNQSAVDERMQFGSLGFRQLDGTTVAFMFPGSEGERNHVVPGNRDSWARRSHPVRPGVQHRYQLTLNFSFTPDYPSLVEQSWIQAFVAYKPIVRTVDVSQTYEGLIETLDHYWMGTGPPNNFDAAGFPFSVFVPTGEVRDYNYQMGFIGRQIPNAYFLLDRGLRTNDQSLRDKGEQVIDFWAASALTDSGLPRTWYDPGRNGASGLWRPSDNPMGGTALRVATTGMEGMLSAWDLMKRSGHERSDWITACRKFGDWLVTNQNRDGSFYRVYDHRSNGPTNEPLSPSKFGAINPLRFLCMLYRATGDVRYRDVALRAGEFCFKEIHVGYNYIGSVIDNPNVIDRETGQEAIAGFLALYDLSQEKKWLDAAVQAARYTETWMYAYEVPPEIGRERCDFPADRSIVGQTIIATGHSAADLGFAFSSFDYYRLYLFTGDAHFLDVAKLLIHNTKQSLNWDGKLYPGKPKGLQLEAFTVTLPRRKGVMECLSWNYAAHLDPLVRFQTAFGSMEIDTIERLPLSRRRELNGTVR